MRRRLLLPATIVAVLALIAPAQAKFEHARVVITGPGLEAPIRLTGDRSGVCVHGCGLWQTKWPAPNIGGQVSPHADLGPAYPVQWTTRCQPGGRFTLRQIAHPYAQGGMQVLTPRQAASCGVMRLRAGYWPAPDSLLDLLVAEGLPETAPRVPEPAGAPSRARGSSGSGPRVAVALAVLAALIFGRALVHRRRASAVP